jgi:hypothetical protein
MGKSINYTPSQSLDQCFSTQSFSSYSILIKAHLNKYIYTYIFMYTHTHSHTHTNLEDST